MLQIIAEALLLVTGQKLQDRRHTTPLPRKAD
jgi:hypothetical protein